LIAASCLVPPVRVFCRLHFPRTMRLIAIGGPTRSTFFFWVCLLLNESLLPSFFPLGPRNNTCLAFFCKIEFSPIPVDLFYKNDQTPVHHTFVTTVRALMKGTCPISGLPTRGPRLLNPPLIEARVPFFFSLSSFLLSSVISLCFLGGMIFGRTF